MYLTMFAVMLAAVVGYTDCHLSDSEQTTKQMSIELLNPNPLHGSLHGINILAISCIEPYDVLFCLNGGRCFNFTVASSSIPSCECATGFWGERCEQKYLSQSYNTENYMQADDINKSQNWSNDDKPRKTHNSINIFHPEIFVGASAVNKVSATVILLLAMLLLHFLLY